MAAIKSIVKGVSQIVGEILVVGGALGTTYVLGFIKGSKISDHVEEAADYIKKEVNAKVKTEPVAETQAEEVTEESQEETTEPETPPIEVTTNQPED